MSDFLDIPDVEEEPVVEEEEPQPVEEEPAVQTFVMPEPETADALSAFNRTWAEQLEAKRQQEQALDIAAKEKAATDLADWNTQRQVKLNANKDKNRSEEQVLLEKVEYELEGGNTWERVTKLIDADADADSEKSDTSRMRKLFIQLKNEPLETTRGAAVEA